MPTRRILILLLMVFIISCGDDGTQEEKKILTCDPNSSSFTTEDISGIWHFEELIITRNDCTDRDFSDTINIYMKFQKLNECEIRTTDCFDGINCNDLKDVSYVYTLENNELKNYRTFEDDESGFDNCHIKESEIETISFSTDLTKAFYKFKQDLSLYPPCYDYEEDLKCSIEGKIDIDKVGEKK